MTRGQAPILETPPRGPSGTGPSVDRGLLVKWRAAITSAAASYVLAAVVWLVAVMFSPAYASPQHLGTLMRLAAMLGIVAIGQTLVMLIGGIDLSVSAVVTLTNLVVAGIVNGSDARLPSAVAVALVLGAVIGLVNGCGIRFLRVPDLVMTLATFTVITGVALLYSGGSPTGEAPPFLEGLVNKRFFGFVPYAVIPWAVLAAITILVLRRSAVGRRIYAIGLSRGTATFSGIAVGRYVVGLYAISGVTAAVTGLLITGYVGASYMGSGDSYQLASIAAVVVGGTSIFGGRGSYGRTIAGVVTIVLLESLLHVVNIAHAGREIAFGGAILMMLFLYRRSQSAAE